MSLNKYWKDNIENNLQLVKGRNLGEKVVGTMFGLELKDHHNNKNKVRYEQVNKLLGFYIESEHFDKCGSFCHIGKNTKKF